MTNREKKAELLKYRSAVQEVVRIEQDIMRWRSQAERMTSSFHLAPAGGSGRSMENAVEQIDALTHRLEEKQKEVIRLWIYLDEAIAAVPDERFKKLLRLRYIDGLTWGKIADIMGYSQRNIIRLHRAALNEVVLECHY